MSMFRLSFLLSFSAIFKFLRMLFLRLMRKYRLCSQERDGIKLFGYLICHDACWTI